MDESEPLPPELVADFLARLAAARGEIEAFLPSATGAGESPLRRLAHQLRGTGTSFGYPAVTRLAGEVEDAPLAHLPGAARRLVELLDSVTPADAERILVVDDDQAMTRLLAAILQGPGRRIHTAATAAEADAVLARETCDLVLLDLFLPDEDGRRLLERWRAAPATRTLPVFILSASLGPDIKTECFTLGADAYFEKPIDHAMITAAVNGKLHRAGHLPPPVATLPAATGRAAGPARILLADDDPLIVSIVAHRLGKAGHTVGHAADGATTLHQVGAALPDLLILDIKMPEMDGLEVLRHLRADPRTRALPVIILTALGDEADVVRGFGLGADDYLVKPFSPTELAVRVDRLLRRI